MSTKTIDLKYLRSIKAVVWLQGREYLTHNGLLRVAHEVGLKSIQSELVHWNAEKKAAVIKTVVIGERGTYTGYGDACPANVAKHLREATLRMAETRAVNRALRLYTGLGMTTTEELPGDHETEEKPPQPTAKAANKGCRAPTMVDTQSHGCAICGELVSDIRASATWGAFQMVMCKAHQEIWERPADSSFTEEVRAAFAEQVAVVDVEYGTLEVRCMASPQWQKRPRHMTNEERERLMMVLEGHYNKKNKGA